MSTAKHADSEQLLQELNLKLYGYEQIYGRLEEEVNPNQRLMGLIKRAYGAKPARKWSCLLMNMMLLCWMWCTNGKTWMYCVISCVTSTVR